MKRTSATYHPILSHTSPNDPKLRDAVSTAKLRSSQPLTPAGFPRRVGVDSLETWRDRWVWES
jgi:hypothetical protein